MKVSTGQPIPAALRGSLEEFFGCDLSLVRLHAGPIPSALAERLRARAFTIGKDIFFAAPGLLFNSRPDVELLVHELAHVCQQKDLPPLGTPVQVGSPDHALEQEAQSAVEAFFSKRPAPRLSRDLVPTLRRAVVIDAGSATIKVTTAGVKPAVDLRSSPIVCNLTRGYTDPNNIVVAFNATGQVKVTAPPAELQAWKFGFIQFQKIKALTLNYGGGFVSNDSIGLFVNQPPALPQSLALDSRAASTPFTSSDPFFMDQGKVTNAMGDHPALRAPASLTNLHSGRVNNLSSLTDHREFWTVFTAKDPAGKLQYLAHFHWELKYDFLFEMADVLKLKFSQSKIDFGTPRLGPPTESELAGLLANPVPPQANDLMLAALRAAVLGGLPNRMDL